jgi:hypothetical protein
MLPEIVYKSLYTGVHAHYKEIYKPFTVTLSTGVTVTVPKGFITDLATVPRIFWGIIPTHGRHDLAVIVHDYLLTQGWDRKEGDKELFYFLKQSNVNPIKSVLIYGCVRLYSLLKT